MNVSASALRSPSQVPSSRHIPALDGLRGAAILMVLFVHSAWTFPITHEPTRILRGFFHAGWTGVDLFFVLSGFLITGILLDTKGAPNYFRSFYGRRILRIFPLYYTVLTTILVTELVTHNQWLMSQLPVRPDWKLYFVYLNNWWILSHDTPGKSCIIGHFWSLAVEEQFYLVWPMVVWLTPVRRVPFLTIALAVAALVVRSVLAYRYPVIQTTIENTVARMDALLLGGLCACIARVPELLRRASRVLPWIVGGSVPIVLIIGFGDREFLKPRMPMMSIGITLIALTFSAIVLYCGTPLGRGTAIEAIFQSPILRAFGKYSYGIYVYHVPIQLVSSVALPNSFRLGENPVTAVIWTVLSIGASFFAAVLSYNLFEKRFLNLKRFFVARTGQAAIRP